MLRIVMLVTVLLLLIRLPTVSWAQGTLVLDCAVTRTTPAFQILVDSLKHPEVAEWVLMERYRFNIDPASPDAFAATPRGENLPAQVTQSETQYRIYFENKRVVVDRLTGEFQVGKRGAEGFFGSGTCQKLGGRRF